jgi:hypothetical protein
MIYLLTAIGLTPGGSSTVHIYTKQYTEHQNENRIYRTEHTRTKQREYINVTIRIHKNNIKIT